MGFFGKLFGPPVPENGFVQPTLDRVIVHINWMTPEQIAEIWPGHLAFTKGPQLLGDGEYHAWLTIPRPFDFEDHSRLETLGHEMFHALGANHNERGIPWPTPESSK
jgi:hypothetical protein